MKIFTLVLLDGHGWGVITHKKLEVMEMRPVSIPGLWYQVWYCSLDSRLDLSSRKAKQMGAGMTPTSLVNFIHHDVCGLSMAMCHNGMY